MFQKVLIEFPFRYVKEKVKLNHFRMPEYYLLTLHESRTHIPFQTHQVKSITTIFCRFIFYFYKQSGFSTVNVFTILLIKCQKIICPY
jgi:hypothetical protein